MIRKTLITMGVLIGGCKYMHIAQEPMNTRPYQNNN